MAVLARVHVYLRLGIGCCWCRVCDALHAAVGKYWTGANCADVWSSEYPVGKIDAAQAQVKVAKSGGVRGWMDALARLLRRAQKAR